LKPLVPGTTIGSRRCSRTEPDACLARSSERGTADPGRVERARQRGNMRYPIGSRSSHRSPVIE
jgi:hypothetical protein